MERRFIKALPAICTFGRFSDSALPSGRPSNNAQPVDNSVNKKPGFKHPALIAPGGKKRPNQYKLNIVLI